MYFNRLKGRFYSLSRQQSSSYETFPRFCKGLSQLLEAIQSLHGVSIAGYKITQPRASNSFLKRPKQSFIVNIHWEAICRQQNEEVLKCSYRFHISINTPTFKLHIDKCSSEVPSGSWADKLEGGPLPPLLRLWTLHWGSLLR